MVLLPIWMSFINITLTVFASIIFLIIFIDWWTDPERIPLASNVIFHQISPVTYPDGKTRSTIAWVMPFSNIIRLSDAQRLVGLNTSAVISG